MTDPSNKTVETLIDDLIDSYKKQSEIYTEYGDTTRKTGIYFFIFSISLLIAQRIITEITPSTNVKIAEINNSTIITASIVCLVCGLALEIAALILFYFYSDSLAQKEAVQRVSIANKMCENLDRQTKNKVQTKIIESLIISEFETQEKSKDSEIDSNKDSSSKTN